MTKEQLLTAEELFGLFNKANDNESFVLNIEEAREERAEEILNKTL